MRARLLVTLLGVTLGSAAPALSGPEDGARAARDADGDGLTDFDEVHKYRTDPAQADSDRDGIPDGDREERREFTYSIRVVVAHLPPAEPVTDLWQDARELRRDAEAVELEITAYPFATAGEVPGDVAPGARAHGLAAFLRPNLTSDFDEALRTDLVAALKQDGIDADAPIDAERATKVAAWALRRMRTEATGFTCIYVTAKDGRLAVVEGLESVFHAAKSDAARTLEEQLDVETRGRSMYRRATCGSCTSTGIYLQTVFRALGVPARTTVGMPAADGNDAAQVERLGRALRPSRFRAAILAGAAGAKGWTEHTFNEVFVGGRWRRLNYSRIDAPIVDQAYGGTLLRVLTYDDRAASGTAETWGRKFGLGLKSERFPTWNPYRLVAASDLLGPHADVALEPGDAQAPSRTHETLTITAARWSRHAERGWKFLELELEEWFDDQDGDQYKRFTERTDLRFVLRAEGRPDVEFQCGVGSFTGPEGNGVIGFVRDEVAQGLAAGATYRVVPRNETSRLRWKVKPGVAVARP